MIIELYLYWKTRRIERISGGSLQGVEMGLLVEYRLVNFRKDRQVIENVCFLHSTDSHFALNFPLCPQFFL